MAEHTPGPWRMADDYDEKDISIGVRANGFPFEYQPARAGGHDQKEAEANAAFIVKACNSFDELVSALQDCLAALDNQAVVNGGEAYPAARSIARAALARAEGSEKPTA